MRTIATITLLAALLPGVAHAQEKCSKLELVNKIQMVREGPRDLVPVIVNDTKMNFLFDTGGLFTQLGPAAAKQLNLPLENGRYELRDVTGSASSFVVTIKQFIVGQMRGTDLTFQVSTSSDHDGIFALDRWQRVDLDVDFGTDQLNMFSPDHCPGAVQYWTAPAIAVIPLTVDKNNHVIVPVMLDGHEEQAILDSGADETSLIQPEEERLFHLTLSDNDTPANGILNGVSSLKIYSHVFKSLSFGDVAVTNPKIAIIPEPPPRLGEREERVLDKQKMIIGMDVLRKLHVYFAFREGKMYISAASLSSAPVASETALLASPAQAAPKPPPAAPSSTLASTPAAVLQSAFRMHAKIEIAQTTLTLNARPDDTRTLNQRCFDRAATKTDLAAARADCEQAVKLAPGDARILDCLGFVFYQAGDYQKSLDTYNAALAIDPQLAPSLFMRGYAKGKLGDMKGKDADISAAKISKPGIDLDFKTYDIAY